MVNQRNYEKKILISYSQESEAHVQLFLNKFEEIKWKIKPNIIKNETIIMPEGKLSLIKNSEAIIFFFCKSNEEDLIGQLKLSIEEDKFVFPVFIDEASWLKTSQEFKKHNIKLDIDDFKVTKTLDFKFIFHAIKWMIESIFEIENAKNLNSLNQIFLHNEETIDFPTRFELIPEHETILVQSTKSLVRIINMRTGCCLREIKTRLDFCLVTWMNNSEKIVIVDRFNCISFYEKNGDLVDSFYPLMNKIKAISYNPTNNKLYFLSCNYREDTCSVGIYDSNILIQEVVHNLENIEEPDFMKIFSNKIFIWINKSLEIDVFSNKLSFQRKLFTKNQIHSIFYSPKFSDFIFVSSNNTIELINTYNFSYIGLIDVGGELKMVINERFIISDYSNSGTYIVKLTVDKHVLDFRKQRDYICKMNPFKQHLYFDPYFLPCGNTACLECIYENYSYIENKIKCNFENCQVEHKLSNGIVRNIKIEEDIRNNFRIMMDFGRYILNKGNFL